MDRDGNVNPAAATVQTILNKLDLLIKRVEDQQESIDELVEKINDAMVDRYGSGYSVD